MKKVFQGHNYSGMPCAIVTNTGYRYHGAEEKTKTSRDGWFYISAGTYFTRLDTCAYNIDIQKEYLDVKFYTVAEDSEYSYSFSAVKNYKEAIQRLGGEAPTLTDKIFFRDGKRLEQRIRQYYTGEDLERRMAQMEPMINFLNNSDFIMRVYLQENKIVLIFKSDNGIYVSKRCCFSSKGILKYHSESNFSKAFQQSVVKIDDSVEDIDSLIKSYSVPFAKSYLSVLEELCKNAVDFYSWSRFANLAYVSAEGGTYTRDKNYRIYIAASAAGQNFYQYLGATPKSPNIPWEDIKRIRTTLQPKVLVDIFTSASYHKNYWAMSGLLQNVLHTGYIVDLDTLMFWMTTIRESLATHSESPATFKKRENMRQVLNSFFGDNKEAIINTSRGKMLIAGDSDFLVVLKGELFGETPIIPQEKVRLANDCLYTYRNNNSHLYLVSEITGNHIYQSDDNCQTIEYFNESHRLKINQNVETIIFNKKTRKLGYFQLSDDNIWEPIRGNRKEILHRFIAKYVLKTSVDVCHSSENTGLMLSNRSTPVWCEQKQLNYQIQYLSNEEECWKNTLGEYHIDSIQQSTHSYGRCKGYILTKPEYLKIAAIVLGSDNILEKVIKSNLPAISGHILYQVACEDRVLVGTGYGPVFINAKYDRGNDNFMYVDTSKKALKSISGLPMSKWRDIENWTKENNELPVLGRINFEHFGGVEKVSAFDQKTFRILLNETKTIGYLEGSGLLGDLIGEVGAKTALTKIEALDLDDADTSLFVDYLRQRFKLKELNSLPEFRFPVFPTKCVKHKEYHREEGINAEEIQLRVKEYQNRYSKKTFVVYQDETTAVLEIRLTAHEAVKWLHDEIVSYYNSVKTAIQDEGFSTAINRLKKYEYIEKDVGLQIVAPQKAQEVADEGAILHHCVGSYIDSIIEGSENILFLRRTDIPQAPFYTVEVVDNDLRQVHCYQNGGLSAEDQSIAYKNSKMEVYNSFYDVQSFLSRWAKKKKLKSDKVCIRYGCYIHV